MLNSMAKHKIHLQNSILACMKDLGITQVALANHFGVSRQCINIWLKGNEVSYQKLMEIADYVGLEVEILVRYK